MMRPLAAVLTACSIALVPAHAWAAAATPLGGDTPQAVVERMTKAAQNKDMKEMAASVDPESRTELTMGMLMGATMMVGFMGMGSDMASGMAEGMTDASKQTKEQKDAAAKQKAEAKVKIDKAKAGLSAVFKKHGLPDLLDDKAPAPKGDPKEMLAKVDQPALIGDLMAFMGTLGDNAPKPSDDKMPSFGKVTDYKITGDKATAKAEKETLDFVKVDGRWYLKPPQKGPAPEAPKK